VRKEPHARLTCNWIARKISEPTSAAPKSGTTGLNPFAHAGIDNRHPAASNCARHLAPAG